MTPRTRRLALAALSALAACNTGDPIRGSDNDAFVAGGRARFARREREAPVDPAREHRVRYRPTLEIGADYVAGDFPQTAADGEYRVSTAYGAFAPELAWRQLCFTPMVGVGYGDAVIRTPTLRSEAEDLGVYFGVEVSMRALEWMQPYARLATISSVELGLSQFEVGVDLRPMREVGVQVAYARRTTEIDLANDSRIDSDGLYVGLSLRF
jgi:hypothetical protein